MQVFFSWSGEASRLAAVALSTCVSEVIQAVEPWLSEAIAKGAQWRTELNSGLEKSTIGVCCLTRDNLKAEWILFEAGAISKTKDAHLCTFLLDLKPADVSGPLAGFQHTVPEKGDVKRLVQLINTTVQGAGEKWITEGNLDKFFDRSWPDLEKALEAAKHAGPPATEPERPLREMVEEILEHVRRAEQPALNGEPSSVETLRKKLLALKRAGVIDPATVAAAVDVVRAAGVQLGNEAAVWGQPVWPGHTGQSVADAAFGLPSSGAVGHVAFTPRAVNEGPSHVVSEVLAYRTGDVPRPSQEPKGERKPKKR